ncbi:MAG: hypothetical protein LBD13_02575 [Spirochaetaceae bacterium]|jgi:predicted hotdog family 3-hydroxylacyl-ACP dehydratase|nr:hypothetical protein [Spirochaetaceae bacterium]
MIRTREELEGLVPHKGRMFLLSRVLQYDSRSLTAEYDITSEGLFYDPNLNGLPSWVCFECMAQGIAALGALTGRKEPSRPGCVLSVSAMAITEPVLPLGSTVTITVREEGRDGRVSSFQGALLLGKARVAEARLTVMEMDGSAFSTGGGA